MENFKLKLQALMTDALSEINIPELCQEQPAEDVASLLAAQIMDSWVFKNPVRFLDICFDRSTIEEKTKITRSMLCNAASDSTPTYEGVDPNVGPYQGPALNIFALETLAYFMRGQKVSLPEMLAAVKRGSRRSAEHERLRTSY